MKSQEAKRNHVLDNMSEVTVAYHTHEKMVVIYGETWDGDWISSEKCESENMAWSDLYRKLTEEVEF